MFMLCCTFALLAACTRSNCDPKTGLPITLVSISISPSLAEVAAGSKQQFVVTALYSNGTKKDLPASDITWVSTNSSAAAISNVAATAGLAATQTPGTTTITATYDGISISTTLTVTAATLVSIEVTPANPSIPVGLSKAFVATGVYSNNTTQNLTNSVTWSSAASTVAVVSNTTGTQGLVTAKGLGASSITATFNGVSGSTPVAVTAATLVSIEIGGIGSSLAKGVTGQLTATGVYSDGSMHDITNSVVWSSLSPQIGSVSASGLVTAVATGSAVLSATLGSVSGTTNLTVTSASLVSIGVTPANASTPKGLTRQFTAIGTFTDGTTQDLTASAVWSSSNTAVATISNASGSSGIATAATIGTTTVAATYDGIIGSTADTVTAATLMSIQISGGQPLPDGTTEPLTATGVYSDGTTQNLTASVVWGSSNAAVVTVSNAAGSHGVVDGQHVGTAALTASLGGVSASINLQITAAILTSIAVTPVNPSIANGTHEQFTATGTYSDNTTQNLTASVLWSPSTGAPVTVSNTAGQNGLATADGVGVVTVTATLGGVSGSSQLATTAATLVSIAVTPSANTLANGTTRQFTATGTYSDGTTQNLTSDVGWTASTPAVAGVSNVSGSNGLATATAQGSTNIIATQGSVSGAAPLTVTAATLVSIAVTPPSGSIADGTDEQFTATGTYTDGTTQNISSQVTWNSSSTAVATVSNASGSYGLATSVGQGSSTVSATLGSVSGSAPLTVTPATLVSIAVTPTTSTLPNGDTQQFTATGTYTDGSTQNLTAQVTWSSSAASVAAINNASGSNGLATATAQGSTTLSATLNGVSGSTPLTVSPAVLVSLAITPPNPRIAKGTTEQFTATGTYSDHSTQNLTTSVSWTSSSSGIAPISNASGSNGLATGSAVGTTTIGASLNGVSTSTGFTVTPATLVSIGVTPTQPSIPNGTSEQFTATGTYTDGTTQNLTSAVSWSSSATSVSSVSNASGSTGVATAAAQGSTTITALLGGISGSTPLTVTSATLVSIGVTPGSSTLPDGNTQQYTASGTYTDGSTQNLTSQVTWSSSAGAVAAISNASGSNGLATATAQGSTTVSAALGSVSGSAPLTVTAASLVSIAVTPSTMTLPDGDTQQYTATGTYSDGTTQNLTSQVTWSSSSTAVASISNAAGSNGFATAAGQGTTTLSAILGSVSGSAPLTVTAATLVSIGVTPSSSSLPNGNTEQFTATGTYSDGSTQNLTSHVTWSSSAGAVATISNASGSNGLATATAPGSTTVSAALGSVSGSAPLAVTAAALVSIAVTPSSSTLPNGDTEQFTAIGTYSDGSTQNLTSQVAWASSSTAVATISNAAGSNGFATAAGQGSTTVSAILGSVSGSAPLTVTAATLVSIAVTPTSSTVPDGDTEQFTAIGTYSDGTTQNLTSQVTWSSASSTDDSISNASGSNGLATATAQGMTTVSATLGSVSGSTPLTVSAATLVSLAITPPNPSIAKGTNEQFTATGMYSDNTTQNLTSSVSWSSSSSSTAAISNASGSNGLANGSAVGTTTIGASINGVSASTGLTVTPATLVSIAVTPTNPSIAAGTSEQFTATGTYSDGTTQNLTSAVSWSSSATSIASISSASGSNGLATSSTQGSTTITAMLSGISGSTPLTVTAATLVSIGVTPPNPSIANGTSTSFTATGTYTDGTTQNLTGSVAWSSSNTAVATISNASGSNGLATSTGQGSTTVSATLGSVSGSAPLTVTAATLVSIGVTPANPTSPKGTTEQFTATGVYTNNTTQNLTSQVTWTSSSSSTASISNASGSKGLAAAAAVGTTTVSAVLSGVTGSTGFTVTQAALTSIAVTPTNPTVADGLTEQFTATGTYTDNTTQNLTSAVTWSSSSSAVAAVSNASGSNGLATSQSVGSTTVSAAIGSISGSSLLTVNPAALVSIAVTPATASIAAGTSEQYVATGTYTDGSTKNLTSTVTWSSSSTAAASVSNASGSNGLATSAATGSTTITAAIGSISGTAALTVTPATLVSIAVTPANQSIAKGTGQQYTATGTYTDGSTQNLTSTVAWTSSSPTVASISNASGSYGFASSAATGSTTITAATGSISGSTGLTVTAATLVSIAVTPANPTIYVGATEQYIATGTYTDGSTQVLTSAVTWSSSNMAEATVSNASGSNGLASGTAAGSVTITANAAPGNVSGSTGLTVSPQYAYVANYSTNSIVQYSIGANGALTSTGASVTTGKNPFFAIINPTNKFLYEVNISDNSLYGYSIGIGGALTFIQSISTDGTPAELLIDPSGQYMYVQDIGNMVTEYSIAANGMLMQIGSIATGTTPFGIRTDPVAPYLYVSDNAGGISEYAIASNGVLSLIGTASTDAGLDKIAIDPTGKYLYVSNSTTDFIEEFTIGSNGVLTQFGSIAAGSYPRTIIFDKSAKYVYVVNVEPNSANESQGNTISEYSVGAGGALTSIGLVTLNGQTPFDITLDATGQFVYVPLRDSDSVAAYSISPTTGLLTPIGSVATASGAMPSGVATIH
jgi:6-phosphogluconolactonase (cycloisomerase 2 family)/urocanate hydratase